MVILVEGNRFSQSASFCRAVLDMSLSSELSNAKNTSSSGREAFTSSSVFRANTSSSVNGFGAGAGAGAGGGGGGGGVVGVVDGGGGGGSGAATGGFFEQADTTSTVARLIVRASRRARDMDQLLEGKSSVFSSQSSAGSGPMRLGLVMTDD
jgi:hypothetical protein